MKQAMNQSQDSPVENFGTGSLTPSSAFAAGIVSQLLQWHQ
jgi:hypothetical protein